MPDRIIRDELLESERWLSLKDNADRLAFLSLLLKADSLGNFTAEPFRLMRLWRDFGISTLPLVAKTQTELADHDLIRLYMVDGKPYLHIPRFGQRTRYVKRVFPPSPWTTIEQNQALADNSPDSHPVRTAEVKGSEVEVKGSEKKRSKPKAAAQAPFVLPDWIPKMQWDAWVDARTRKRNAPSPFALQMAVTKLEHLKTQGHHPAAVLAQSAFSGWAGLFPMKEPHQ